MKNVKAVLLDVNGTLFPPSAAKDAFLKLGLDPSGVEAWFSAVLRDAFAAQLSGVFQPFRSFAAYHLGLLLSAAGNGGVSEDEAVEQLVLSWRTAQAFPDVAPGIRALNAAGIQVAVLTNGSEAIAGGVLGRAGVLELVAPLLDINMAQAWKPASSSYCYAVGELGLQPEEVMMVASHPWDIHGALQAGLQGAYIQRSPHEPYPPFLPLQPQLVVPTFEELAAGLGGRAG